jgi:MFS family permease
MKKKAVTAEHPVVAKKIDDSLKLSVKEGSIASASFSLGESYLAPFALALSATSTQMGILYAITSLVPGLIQLKAATLIEKFSRKKIVISGTFVRLLLFIPIILTGFFFYMGVPYMSWALILFVGLLYASSGIVSPTWFSWMGSLVPEDKRGKYFSRRNRVTGFFGIIAMIAGAIFLDGIKAAGIQRGDILGFTLLGFGLLFTIAATMRGWSIILLKKQYEPRLKIRKRDYFTFTQFLSRCSETPFGRFALFRTVLSFAIGISGPFWAVYILRDLGFSYLWFIIILVSTIGFQLMFLPLLGKFSDRFGNVKLMSVCSWLIATIPLLFIASVFIKNDFMILLYLMFIPAIVEGFAWAGYNLAVNNYVFDAVSSPKVSFGLSYMNLMVGIGMFAGAAVGSLLAWINVSFMNPLLFIFLVSAGVRFLIAIFGIRFLDEVRHVKKFSSNYLIREFHPADGIVREVHHLEHLVKKVEHYI